MKKHSHKHSSCSSSENEKNRKIEGNLLVEGSLDVEKDLQVKGDAKFKQDVDIKRNLNVGGNEFVKGNLNVAGTISAPKIITNEIDANTVDTNALCLNDQTAPPPVMPNAGCLFTLAGQPDTLNFQDNQGTTHQIGYTANTFTYTITLDLEQWDPVNLIRIALNQPFDVKLEVRVQDSQISIRVPYLNFTLVDPTTGLPVPGYVYTVAGSNLPRNIWPVDLVPQAFWVGGNQTSPSGYQLTIGTDGTLNVSGPDSGPIGLGDNGGHILNAVTFTYLIPLVVQPPPPNIQLSSGASTIIGSALDEVATYGAANDFRDYYANCIQTDVNGVTRVSYAWADNSNETGYGRTYTTIMYRTGISDAQGNVVYSPAVDVTHTQSVGVNVFDTEATLAIDPNDANHVVITFTRYDYRTAEYGQLFIQSIFAATSHDGGQTWVLFLLYDAPLTPFNGWVIIDTYSNVWVSAGVADPPGNEINPDAFDMQLLAPDGLSATPVVHVRTLDIVGGGFPDYQKTSYGPDGSGIPGNLAVWFSYDDATFTFNTTIVTIGFLLVSGPGEYTPFNINTNLIRAYGPGAFTNIPNGAGGIGLSQIFVNPVSGAVYFLSTNVNDLSGLSNTNGDASISWIWVNPTGTVNYNPNSFLPQREIFFGNSNIKSVGIITTRPLPWIPGRGQLPNNTRGMGFDPNTGRLYASFWDMRPNLSNQNVLMVTWSDNNGESWSDPYIFNDDPLVSAGKCSISVDPVTGLIAAGWYDPRGDPTQQSVNYFGAVFPAPYWTMNLAKEKEERKKRLIMAPQNEKSTSIINSRFGNRGKSRQSAVPVKVDVKVEAKAAKKIEEKVEVKVPEKIASKVEKIPEKIPEKVLRGRLARRRLLHKIE